MARLDNLFWAGVFCLGVTLVPATPARADDWLGRLFSSGDPNTEGITLTLAASHGMLAMARIQLARGVDVNSRDHHGYTPLIRAAQDGSPEVVRLLLDHGANVDAREDFGYTALMWAVEKGNVECVRLLLSHGANPTAPFGGVPTALELAKHKDRPHMVALIQREAGPRGANDRAPAPVQAAAAPMPQPGVAPVSSQSIVIPVSMPQPQSLIPQGSPLIPPPAPALVQPVLTPAGLAPGEAFEPAPKLPEAARPNTPASTPGEAPAFRKLEAAPVPPAAGAR